MGPRRLLALAFMDLATAVYGISARGQHAWMRTTGWIEESSFVLEVPGMRSPENQTAVVTFAGKKDVEYIDGAAMLGLSIQKHLPGYPMVAMIIEKMSHPHRAILRGAGWTLVTVPNWEGEYCGEGCNPEFLGRWHDSFEKINAFRLPFQRVLFMDSDTYVFSNRLQEVMDMGYKLPSDHIAMAKDGCKAEYNSGVMLYRPNVTLFTQMLELVTKRQREQILDQSIVNEVYRDKVVEISRDFNCVDIMGIQPGMKKACEFKCRDKAVVAHFTGHPKPTTAKRRLLELVRRPGSPALACTNTNFGSCAKWSQYYCDVRASSKKLSTEIQAVLHSTGECCHSPFDATRDKESCKECPAALLLRGASTARINRLSALAIDGTYMKTTIKSGRYNGGKPIFVNRMSNMKAAPMYLYYVQAQVLWMISGNYSSNTATAYAGKDAQCPRDAGAWHFWNGTSFEMRPFSVRAVSNPPGAPTDTEHIVWNVKRRRWDREEAGRLSFDDDEKEAHS
jgi:hypothetical protein